MFVRECAPVITNNTMRGNTALVASGIIASQANGIVVTRNVIQKVGLGLGIFETSGATASFNTISFTSVRRVRVVTWERDAPSNPSALWGGNESPLRGCRVDRAFAEGAVVGSRP